MRFDGKRVIVTGAGSGFGEAIAKRFAAEGARVLLADVNLAGAERVAYEISGGGGTAVPLAVNVAEEAQIEAMVQRAVDEWGGVDVLVNNAGYSHRQKLLWKITVEEFDDVFGVNVRGVFLGCKHAIPVMMEAGGGVIVNIASVGAIAPRPGVTPYNGTKGAVLTMTKGLALECARHNIRVNAVNPVAAETGFMKGATGQDELSEELKANLISTIPLARLTEPADIAAAVTFLASEDAAFITGTAMNVDGGRTV
ncbi:MAG: SDR family oxidoreductase [Gammaproteobacteria bacterium]|nr:MAG: SDR family oxidoreductase [Gammaproteobacteria bacterium]